MKGTNLLVMVAAVTALAACSSGGGSDSQTAQSNFVVSAQVAGSPVSGFSVTPGQSGTIEIASSQELQLDSTTPVSWVTTENGVTVSAKTVTQAMWKAGLFSAPPKAVTFVVTSTTDATKSASITVNVAPQRFASPRPAVGDQTAYQEVETRRDGTTNIVDYQRTVTNVNADGTATQNQVISGTTSRIYELDTDGNRTSTLQTSNDRLCAYTPSRRNQAFPLFVGKTYTSTYETSCFTPSTSFTYTESASVTGNVEAYESVTTIAGTFDALKVNYVISYTNSNDGNLTGGGAGNGVYNITETCWWSPLVGRVVKCEMAYAYPGSTPPTNYLSSVTQQLTSYSKQ